jgi:hypothetical protein
MSVESARELGLKAPRLRGGVVGRIEWGEDPRVQLLIGVECCPADLPGRSWPAPRSRRGVPAQRIVMKNTT